MTKEWAKNNEPDSTTEEDSIGRLATPTPRVTVMLQSLGTTEYLPPLAALDTLSHAHTHLHTVLMSSERSHSKSWALPPLGAGEQQTMHNRLSKEKKSCKNS